MLNGQTCPNWTDKIPHRLKKNTQPPEKLMFGEHNSHWLLFIEIFHFTEAFQLWKKYLYSNIFVIMCVVPSFAISFAST